ncbi:TnsA endonuclease N-terminal domain-containing protein [Bacillus cereus]
MYNPIKMPRNKSFGNNYWEVYSPKLSRTVRLFSNLEYEHWLLIEIDRTIKNFCEQPLKIQYFKDGRMKESIFDMWIQYHNQVEEFREVKHIVDLPTSRAKQQIELQKNWCNDHGYSYKVVTDYNIRSNHILLDNAKIIIPYLKNSSDITIQDMNSILKFIEIYKNISIKDIKQSFNQWHPNKVLHIIYRLLYNQEIHGDIEKSPLNNYFKVWLT